MGAGARDRSVAWIVNNSALLLGPLESGEVSRKMVIREALVAMGFGPRDLVEAERHIAEVQKQIADQKTLIAELEASGHGAAARARRLLTQFKETLRLAENHRNLIIEEITRG